MLALVLVHTAPAILILEDNFDYPAGTTLDANGWGNNGYSPKLFVAPGSLEIAGLAPPIGNMCMITNAAYPQHPNYMSRYVEPPTEGYLYHSFIMCVTDLSAIRDHGTGFTNFYAMGVNANNSVAGVRTNVLDPSRYDIGIAYDCPGLYAAWHDNGGTGYEVNTTNFIVLRLLCTNELVSTPPEESYVAWINPPASNFSGADPGNPDLLSRRRMNQAGGGTQQINLVTLTARTGANILLDEIRIGTTWADVTPKLNDFIPRPENAAPTPDELTSLTPVLQSSEYLGTPPNTHSASVFSVRSLTSPAQWQFAIGPETNFTIPAAVLAQSTYYAWKVQYIGTLGVSHYSYETIFRTEHTAGPLALAYDGAGYAPTTTVSGLSGGGGWSTPWQQSVFFTVTSAVAVVEPGLLYGDLIVTGGAFAIRGDTNQTRAARTIAVGDGMAHLLQTNLMFGRAGSTNWFALLAACGDDYTNGAIYFELLEGTIRRVNIGKSTLSRWIAGSPGQTRDAGGYTPDTTLLVTRLACSDSDATNGTMLVWLNPLLGETPPDDSTAAISLDAVRPFAFNRIGLYADAYRATVDEPFPPLPSAVLDEVRMGEDWLSVIEIPEPAGLLLVVLAAWRLRRS